MKSNWLASGTSWELFRGDVTALEYHYLEESRHEVYLRAYDRLHRLRKRQQVRTFEDVDLAELAGSLCKDLGLKGLKLPRSGLAWPLFVQHNQNDLDLLVEMAALEGLYLTLRGSDLYLTTLEGLPAEPVRLKPLAPVARVDQVRLSSHRRRPPVIPSTFSNSRTLSPSGGLRCDALPPPIWRRS